MEPSKSPSQMSGSAFAKGVDLVRVLVSATAAAVCAILSWFKPAGIPPAATAGTASAAGVLLLVGGIWAIIRTRKTKAVFVVPPLFLASLAGMGLVAYTVIERDYLNKVPVIDANPLHIAPVHYVGTPIRLAVRVRDSDGDVVHGKWSTDGDGSVQGARLVSDSLQATFTPLDAGPQTVRVDAVDEWGASTSHTFKFRIEDWPIVHVFDLDVSARMAAHYGSTTRLKAAKAVISSVDRSLLNVAGTELRTFGRGSGSDCGSYTQPSLPLAPQPTNEKLLTRLLRHLQPGSKNAPLMASIVGALNDILNSFSEGMVHSRQAVTLQILTGGFDNCPPGSTNLRELVDEIAQSGVEVRISPIGLNLADDPQGYKRFQAFVERLYKAKGSCRSCAAEPVIAFGPLQEVHNPAELRALLRP
jgi:hypothetical protein